MKWLKKLRKRLSKMCADPRKSNFDDPDVQLWLKQISELKPIKPGDKQ